MSLQTNLTMIKLLLDDIRSGEKYNSNDTKVIRYLLGNIYNAALNKKLGLDKDIESPDYAYMSESFKEEWEAAGNPAGVSALKQFGIHEHYTPLNVLITRMVQECTDEASIYEFASNHNILVFVTKKEDECLNQSGYQRSLPTDGKDRYGEVGIKIHPEPILYKNFKRKKK